VADLFVAKLRTAELRSALQNLGRYLSAREVAPLYEKAYSTFQKYLKMLVEKGGYEKGAFRKFQQKPGSPKREYVLIEIHPTLGIEELDRFFGC
jgi:hypothetical protein